MSFIREEFAPTPGRWRHAVFAAFGSTLALALAMALQVDTFFAPLIAFTALQPHTLCNWGRMLRGIWICTVAVVLTVMFGSVLLQVPWLLLPCFFVAVSAVLYAIPVSSLFLEALAVLPPMTRTLYVGVFHPEQMGAIALSMWSAYAIGIGTATAIGRLLSPEHPRDELAAALAASFRRTRERLCVAGERFRDLSQAARPPEQPLPSALASRLLLLDRARQEGLRHDDERLLMALMTAAERSEGTVELAHAAALQSARPTYRRLLAAELATLLAALDAALTAFEHTALRVDRRSGAPAAPGTWPDLIRPLRAVEQRQLEARHAGAFAGIDVAEAANVNAFVDALRGLVLVLRISPSELEHIAAGDPGERPAEPEPRSVLRLDPYAARFALKCGLATTIALQIPVAANVDALFSLIVAPFLVAQTSYGATIEKAPLRLLGVLIGGVLALLTIIALMPNTNDLALWLVAFFLVVCACAYSVLGGPRVSYVATQVAVTYLFVTVAAGPATDVGLALWRAFGNFVGGVIIVAVFGLVAPDYAGRQLIARLGDLLRDVLDLLPPREIPSPALLRAVSLQRHVGFSVADILRLVAEARLEGTRAGIVPQEAVETAGLAQRIAYRAVAICRARVAPDLPPPPAALNAALIELTAAIRAHLEILRRILAARHTMARPGSHAYHRACLAAAGIATCPRPHLQRSLQTLLERADHARTAELAEWPPAATGALFAEVDHLRRIVELLPALDAQLVRMCLPPEEGFEGSRVRGFKTEFDLQPSNP
jgi:uncharacterized membrane protein YccC